MTRLLELRTYMLKPGAGAAFHDLAASQSIPMARAAGMDVVAHGPSLHDPDAYFLIRAYDSLGHREALQNEFYGSDAWRRGPREAIVALIETDLDAVLWMPDDSVEALRRSPTASESRWSGEEAAGPQAHMRSTDRVVEIRTLALLPATGSRFRSLFEEKSLPLMLAAGMDVVAFGPSAHDPDVFVVVRSFESLSSRENEEDAYYGSAAWREGPRDAMLALVSRYQDAVLLLPVASVETLRRSQATARDSGQGFSTPGPSGV